MAPSSRVNMLCKICCPPPTLWKMHGGPGVASELLPLEGMVQGEGFVSFMQVPSAHTSTQAGNQMRRFGPKCCITGSGHRN